MAAQPRKPARKPTPGERDAAKALARQMFLKQRRATHPDEGREALGDAWSRERRDHVRTAMQVLRGLQAQGYALTRDTTDRGTDGGTGGGTTGTGKDGGV